MKSIIALIVLNLGLLPAVCGIIPAESNGPFTRGESKQHASSYNITMKRDLLCIMMGYSKYISGIEKDADGKVYVITVSGKRIIYDDGILKSNEQRMANADIQDMMEQVYPIFEINKLLEKDYDPGRARVYSLLKEVYGSSKKQAVSNLVNISTPYGSLLFNKNNNAAYELKQVFNELIPIAQRDKIIENAIFPSSGTFNYRNIAGTGLLSPHSFGIAIDLARDKRDYWQWASRSEGQKRIESYPREIVAIFEKHNFIWGGKWGHFDILHFEYRPEILYKARLFKSSLKYDEWYCGAPENDPNVKKYINVINEALD